MSSRLPWSPGQITAAEAFPAGGFTSGRGSGRRQVQIVGGGFNTPRYNGNNNFASDNMASTFATDNYNGMNGFGGDYNEQPNNMFTPQGYGANGANNYAGFSTGQMGNNYI